MTADRLRAAARVLRGSAAAATPGPWYWEPPSPDDWPSADESLMSSVNDEPVLTGWGYDASGITATNGDRAYIATMHPGIGLALANALDSAADYDPELDYDGDGEGMNADLRHLADLILGGESS